tara:strand:- start:163 stop:417 length:255 start_codon:yes stop_codon:yes gene_type:complete
VVDENPFEQAKTAIIDKIDKIKGDKKKTKAIELKEINPKFRKSDGGDYSSVTNSPKSGSQIKQRLSHSVKKKMPTKTFFGEKGT